MYSNSELVCFIRNGYILYALSDHTDMYVDKKYS